MFRPSMLGEILKLLPRGAVSDAVENHGADRWCKSFKTWDHLVAMVLGQLSGAASLRDVEMLSAQYKSQHYHLGCRGVKRSTLADANARRESAVFAEIVQSLIVTAAGQGRAGTKHIGPAQKLLSVLDSSSIQLSGRGLEWAEETRMRGTNQGLKLHLMLRPEAGMIDWARITDMNVNDITAARDMALEEGRIYVFDKGYFDFNWWHSILEHGSSFVTRIKINTAYEVLETRPLGPDEGGNILKDRLIRLTNKHPRGGKTNMLAGRVLRLIEIAHPGGRKPGRRTRPFLIVSDMIDAPASEITALYKRRWDIELLFKWIKQNLKIKRFMGKSRNAILIQIYVALIAYLLVRLYKDLLGSAHPGRLKDLILNLKTGLFHPRPHPNKRHEKPPNMQLEIWQSP